MRYRGSKLKKPEKCDFCGIFYRLNGVKSKYKGLPTEKTIGSYYLESSKFYKPHWVEIRHVVSEIFDPKHYYFPCTQNTFGHSEPKCLKF